ncbi:hypothetical protein TWF132_008706 [Orbilia oligospora]|nr:hypothetical protein TWF132_008706 [Orbilia oligospora]
MARGCMLNVQRSHEYTLSFTSLAQINLIHHERRTTHDGDPSSSLRTGMLFDAQVYLSRANEPRTPSYNPKIRACIHRKEPSQAQTSSSFRAELEKTDRATGKPANDNYFPNELELRIPAPESAGFFKSP